MACPQKVERGKKYHANFIYNYPRLKNKRKDNSDWVTSYDVVRHCVELLVNWGFESSYIYYHDRDALPGGNIFDEFFRVVKSSSYTIVVVTKGFVNDCWGKYRSQSAFMNLLDHSNSKRFIGLYIAIDDCHIPDEMKILEPLSFSENWKNEKDEWVKLYNLLSLDNLSVQDTGRDPYPVTMVTSRPNYYSGNIPPDLTRGRGGLNSQILVGVQDTRPPDLQLLRRNEDIATDAPNTSNGNSIVTAAVNNDNPAAQNLAGTTMEGDNSPPAATAVNNRGDNPAVQNLAGTTTAADNSPSAVNNRGDNPAVQNLAGTTTAVENSPPATTSVNNRGDYPASQNLAGTTLTADNRPSASTAINNGSKQREDYTSAKATKQKTGLGTSQGFPVDVTDGLREIRVSSNLTESAEQTNPKTRNPPDGEETPMQELSQTTVKGACGEDESLSNQNDVEIDTAGSSPIQTQSIRLGKHVTVIDDYKDNPSFNFDSIQQGPGLPSTEGLIQMERSDCLHQEKSEQLTSVLSSITNQSKPLLSGAFYLMYLMSNFNKYIDNRW